MQQYASHILSNFPVRRKAGERERFTGYLSWELRERGYTPRIESGRSGTYSNVVVGDVEKAKLIFSAHYDTGAREMVPSFLSPTRPVVYLLTQAAIAVALTLAAFVISFAVTFVLSLPGLTLPMFLVLMAAVMCYPRFAPSSQYTANDNTSGTAALLELAAALSPRFRNEVAFAFLDKGADGAGGARGFAREHAEVLDQKTVIDLDCVGSGDTAIFAANKLARWDGDLLAALEESFGEKDGMHALVRYEGLFYFPGDSRKLRNHVAVCTAKRLSGFGYFISAPRTKRGDALEERNISYIVEGLKKVIEKYCV